MLTDARSIRVNMTQALAPGNPPSTEGRWTKKLQSDRGDTKEGETRSTGHNEGIHKEFQEGA